MTTRSGQFVTRYDPDRTSLDDLLSGEPRYRVDQVWRGLYADVVPLDEVTTLPKALRARLADTLPAALEETTRSTSPDGNTTKLLWTLHGGATVETVLMLYPDRATVCVSTQAGCAMACSFCATGQAGFERHLSVGEIVEQVARAIVLARPRRVSNIVFMGMGEPLANADSTLSSARRIHDAFGISARHITVSTVGLVPGILRLADEPLPLNLAVSLHAADDDLRNELVPINRRYPLDRLAEACRTYVDATHRRLSFEWAMIDGVNDRDADADRLAAYANPLRAHVNLIPLNPTPGYGVTGTSAIEIRAFADRLADHGVNATIRANRGTDIDAACGQLRTRHAESVAVTLGRPQGPTPVDGPPRSRLGK